MKKRGAFFYILILLALLAVAALVYLLAPGRQQPTPAVLLPTPQPIDASAPTAPEQAAGGDLIAVTPATVQTVVKTLRRSDSYSRTLSVQDFWSGGRRSRTLRVWVRGDNLRISIAEDDSAAAQENILIKGGEKWIWYSDSGSVYRGPLRAGDADGFQTLLTYEALLNAPVEEILEAGYTVFAEKNCISVRWRSGELGYVSECFIDPATGLLMGERRYDGEILIYSMESTDPDLTTPDDSMFAEP